MSVRVCVFGHTNKERKWKDTSEVKLEPLAAISLIGLRGQQGSIDGSITLSIWWPTHIGLANRGLDAGHTRAPSLRLSYCARRGYVTLTQKNLSDHLSWFTPRLHCPVNPLDQLKSTFLMQEDLCCKLLHSGKIRVYEIWHLSSVFVLDFFKPDSDRNLIFCVWYLDHLLYKTISLYFFLTTCITVVSQRHVSITVINFKKARPTCDLNQNVA